MLSALFWLAFSQPTQDYQKYINRVIPKVLWYESFKGSLTIEGVENSNSDGSLEIKVKSEDKISKLIIKEKGNDYEPIWAEVIESKDKTWTYSKPTDEITKVCQHYLSMMVNSIFPPKIVRIVSHRSAIQSGSEHHQSILLTELNGRRSLLDIEYKYIANHKHTFVNHAVIVSDGQEI